MMRGVQSEPWAIGWPIYLPFGMKGEHGYRFKGKSDQMGIWTHPSLHVLLRDGAKRLQKRGTFLG